MDEVNQGFTAGPDDVEMMRLVDRQAELLEAQERAGTWTYENDIDTVLTKLGFSDEHRELPIGRLSGGWRNRAALAKVILQQPQVLLMDEPTNYLDIAGLRWLESWFQKFDGALIVISHDRQFLEAVCNRIVEVENHRQGLSWRIARSPVAIEIFADDPLAGIRFTRPLKGGDRFYFPVEPKLKNDREGNGQVNAAQHLGFEFVPLERDTEDLDFRHGL